MNQSELSNLQSQQQETKEFLKQMYQANQQKEKEEIQVQPNPNSLNLLKGEFCINCLTQYPKDDKKNYMIPFVNLLHEKIDIDIRKEQPEKTLQSALMTTYGFESELVEPIARQKVQFVLVNDQSNNAHKDIIETSYQGYKNWTLIMPKKTVNMGQFHGSFHPKIWLLKFPKFLRIVIGSANLHVADWTVWAQSLYIHDFQLKKDDQKEEKKSNQIDYSDEFKQILYEFMIKILPKDCNFEQMLNLKLDDYDIKDVKIRLIPSIPGRFQGNELYKYGQTRVYSVIFEELQKQKMNPLSNFVLTYQTTSMGVMDSKATNLMLQNFSGRPKEQVNNNKILKEMFQKEEKKAEIKSEIKIIYPTADYIINQTHGGVDFANPLFLRKKQFYDIKFNRDVLHKFEGSDNYCWHTGCIPHIKVFILTNEKMEINDDSIIYIGSHNLSKAAWGSMEKNQQQLFIANTELGILYPPRKDSQKEKQQIIERLPFKFPAQKYDKADKPWIAEEYYESLDQ